MPMNRGDSSGALSSVGVRRPVKRDAGTACGTCSACSFAFFPHGFSSQRDNVHSLLKSVSRSGKC